MRPGGGETRELTGASGRDVSVTPESRRLFRYFSLARTVLFSSLYVFSVAVCLDRRLEKDIATKGREEYG